MFCNCVVYFMLAMLALIKKIVKVTVLYDLISKRCCEKKMILKSGEIFNTKMFKNFNTFMSENIFLQNLYVCCEKVHDLSF